MTEWKFIVYRETPHTARPLGIFDSWRIARCVRKHCQRVSRKPSPKDRFYVLMIHYNKIDTLFLRLAYEELPF